MTKEEIVKLFDNLIVVPLSAIPAQRFQCVLNNQNCTIEIKLRGEYCYFSLVANGNTVTNNTICLCGNNLVPYNNQYFVGSLFFIDISNNDSIPEYTSFNTRYRLVYVPFRFDDTESLTA